jgi:hypothetical protein
MKKKDCPHVSGISPANPARRLLCAASSPAVAPGLDQQAACDPLNARFVQVVGSAASDNVGALRFAAT